MVRPVQRILLVEPEGVLAEVTAFRLELLGYGVEIVASADEAVKCATSTRPNLIITDLNLGNANAISLLESLASQQGTNTIPVMVLSIDADLDRVTAAYKSGASDFLVVPYQPEVLQEKVVKLLSRSQRAADEKSKAPAT